jgi:hypothetical protein
MYMPLLNLAWEVADGTKSAEAAGEEARAVIRDYITPEVGSLTDRLRPTTSLAGVE